MDRHLLNKLIIFAVLIIFGLVGYLVVVNLLIPPEVPVSANVARVLQGNVDPQLNTQALALMRSRSDYQQASLAAFEIYLEDIMNTANDNTQVLHLLFLDPVTPLDKDYPRVLEHLAAATASGVPSEWQLESSMAGSLIRTGFNN